MKIALLVPGFSAHEQDWCIPALLNYVRALSQQADVHVFTLRWPERGGTYPVFGATVHALDGRQRLGWRAFGLWARALRTIAAEHRRAPFDVIHAFWADEPGWVAALAARRLKRPFILSLAGGELIGLPDIGYGLLLLPGRKTLVRWALRQAARVTAGSQYLCELARARGACDERKITRVPLGVDTALFSPRFVVTHASASSGSVVTHGERHGERQSNRNHSASGGGFVVTHASASGAAIILNVGSLYPVKDQALLLRAFRRVSRELPQAQLWLVGDGPLKADLLGQAEGLPVRFWGAVNHAALPEVYHQASVLVQTSRHEAQGMAVLEAAACGAPVVGTPVGVLPEIGLVTRDEDALAQALIELLCDPARLKTLGEAARRRVESEFALSLTVKRFRQLYAGGKAG